jgi:hypothetical protein
MANTPVLAVIVIVPVELLVEDAFQVIAPVTVIPALLANAAFAVNRPPFDTVMVPVELLVEAVAKVSVPPTVTVPLLVRVPVGDNTPVDAPIDRLAPWLTVTVPG